MAEQTETQRYTARLLDASSPHPVVGRVAIDGDALDFIQADGDPFAIPLDQIDRTQAIGGELYIHLRPAAPGRAGPQLVVSDTAFERVLDDARKLHANGPVTHIKVWSKRIGLRGWLAATAVVIPLAYLALTRGVMAGHVFVPVAKERALGELIYSRIEQQWTVSSDRLLQASVQTLVERLVEPHSEYQYQVTIFESEDANAFALPGGRIVLLSGLFRVCESPESLAGVLAHEIAHVERRHGLKQLLRSAGVVAFMSMAIGGGVEQLGSLETLSELSGLLFIFQYSRALERQADELAVETLHRHHLSTGGLIAFLEAMQKESILGRAEKALAWVSTHPLTESRIEMLREARAGEATDRPATDLLGTLAENWPPTFPNQEADAGSNNEIK